MSAKPAKKNAKKSPSPSVPRSDAGAAPAASTPGPAATPSTVVPMVESADPRRRLIGKLVLAGVWLYVAALWLLALDQTFNWGIFGPEIPPLP